MVSLRCRPAGRDPADHTGRRVHRPGRRRRGSACSGPGMNFAVWSSSTAGRQRHAEPGGLRWSRTRRRCFTFGRWANNAAFTGRLHIVPERRDPFEGRQVVRRPPHGRLFDDGTTHCIADDHEDVHTLVGGTSAQQPRQRRTSDRPGNTVHPPAMRLASWAEQPGRVASSAPRACCAAATVATVSRMVPGSSRSSGRRRGSRYPAPAGRSAEHWRHTTALGMPVVPPV